MKFPNLSQHNKIGYDTETTGLLYPHDKVFGFSIATSDEEFYFDIRETPKAVDWINDEMARYNGIIACHNASFDYSMSSYSGIFLPINQMDDTAMRACLIDEHLFSYKLDDLAKKYLGEEKVSEIYEELAKLFGGLATRNVQMKNIRYAPPELVRPYAEKDARLAYDLHEWQDEEIVRQGIERIVAFETELLPIFIEAQMRGIRVDLEYAQQAMDKLTPEIKKAQKKLNSLAGKEVNTNSTPQVRSLFKPIQNEQGEWFTEQGEPMGKTNSGAPSVNAEFLRASNDEKAKLVIDIRSLLKTRDTFLGKHVLQHAVGDRVYPNINQNKGEDGGTGTGRLSYSGPAMIALL